MCFAALMNKELAWYDKPHHSKVSNISVSIIVTSYLNSYRVLLHLVSRRMPRSSRACSGTALEQFCRQWPSWSDGADAYGLYSLSTDRSINHGPGLLLARFV